MRLSQEKCDWILYRVVEIMQNKWWNKLIEYKVIGLHARLLKH